MKASLAAIALTALFASGAAAQGAEPQATAEAVQQRSAERVADLQAQHDRLVEQVRQWSAGPERENAEKELGIVQIGIDAIKADLRKASR